MFNTLFDRPIRETSLVEDVPNEIDLLDEEDGYDRFSKRTKYESKSSYNAYAGVEKDEDDSDVEDFYDRDWSME